MDAASLPDLKAVRNELDLSQSQLADLLGVSPRTVQSCEQGWRKPSPALERSLLLLLMASRQGADFGTRICWDALGCSAEDRERCLAYRSRQGHLCWLLSGNICQGKRLRSWRDKKAMCMQCAFFRQLLSGGIPTVQAGT